MDLQFKQATSLPIRDEKEGRDQGGRGRGGRGQGDLGSSPGRAGEAVPALVSPGSRYVFVSGSWSRFSIRAAAII